MSLKPVKARPFALVEQIELQGAALGQRLDRRRPQAGNPVEPGRLQLVVNAGLRDPAPAADPHHGPSAPVAEVTEEVRRLVDDMFETMDAA